VAPRHPAGQRAAGRGAVASRCAGRFKRLASDVAMSAGGSFPVAYVRDTTTTNPDVFTKQKPVLNAGQRNQDSG
jgi:hypothetical protein